MSEMKNAVGAGTGRSGDDLCAGNSVREFKIWADVLNYGKKILKNAGIVEADLDARYLFEQIFAVVSLRKGEHCRKHGTEDRCAGAARRSFRER